MNEKGMMLERIKLSIIQQMNDKESAMQYLIHPGVYLSTARHIFKIDDYNTWFMLSRIDGREDSCQVEFIDELRNPKEYTVNMSNGLSGFEFIQERYLLEEGKLFFYHHEFEVDFDDYAYFRCSEVAQYYVQFNLTGERFVESGNPVDVIRKWSEKKYLKVASERYLDIRDYEIRELINKLKLLINKPEHSSLRLATIINALEAYLQGKERGNLIIVLSEINDKLSGVY